MDGRVQEFVRSGAQTIVGLDVALFYQSNPSTFDTPLGIALRTHRSEDEVEPALERLAGYGVLERHGRGDGKYVCYALTRDAETWNLLCLVSEAYLDDPGTRKEMIRLLVKLRHGERSEGEDSRGQRGESA